AHTARDRADDAQSSAGYERRAVVKAAVTTGGQAMSLARVISNQSRAVVVFVALLCAAGIYAAFQLPIAIFPQTDFPRIVIIVDNGVVPAPQMLVSVTRPIEEAMNGIPNIQRIRS